MPVGLSRPRRAMCLLSAILVLGGLLSYAIPAHAQREPGSLTVGAQAGWAGGLTGKLYVGPETAYDALFTFDGDDFAQLSVFRVRERPLPNTTVHVYYGPGLLVGGLELNDASLLRFGAGGRLGLNFFAGRFEVFLHATPILQMRTELMTKLEGGLGLRYNL